MPRPNRIGKFTVNPRQLEDRGGAHQGRWGHQPDPGCAAAMRHPSFLDAFEMGSSMAGGAKMRDAA